MHLSSDNIKCTSYSEVNEIIEKLFKPLYSKYQDGLETSMKRSDFIFDLVQLLHYKCHKVNFKRGASYIDSPNWIKKKKAKMNPKIEDDKCFQYSATVALNFGEIESYSEKVSNIIPFINKYNWEVINHPSKIDDWRRFEKNNPAIAFNILLTKQKEILPAYISNHKSTCEKQIVLLIITNEEKEGQHYLAVKKYLHCYEG